MARYGAKASETVKDALHKRKRGTLRSGKNGRGGKVTSRKQAIAIGLSEARSKGGKVAPKRMGATMAAAKRKTKKKAKKKRLTKKKATKRKASTKTTKR